MKSVPRTLAATMTACAVVASAAPAATALPDPERLLIDTFNKLNANMQTLPCNALGHLYKTNVAAFDSTNTPTRSAVRFQLDRKFRFDYSQELASFTPAGKSQLTAAANTYHHTWEYRLASCGFLADGGTGRGGAGGGTGGGKAPQGLGNAGGAGGSFNLSS